MRQGFEDNKTQERDGRKCKWSMGRRSAAGRSDRRHSPSMAGAEVARIHIPVCHLNQSSGLPPVADPRRPQGLRRGRMNPTLRVCQRDTQARCMERHCEVNKKPTSRRETPRRLLITIGRCKIYRSFIIPYKVTGKRNRRAERTNCMRNASPGPEPRTLGADAGQWEQGRVQGGSARHEPLQAAWLVRVARPIP